MERKIPTIWLVRSWAGEAAILYHHDAVGSTTPVASAAWPVWLALASTQRFAYPVYDRQQGYIDGWITVRKERRQRGGVYWVAYRRVKGQVRKAYIGRSVAVTAERLEAIACQFHGKEVPPKG